MIIYVLWFTFLLSIAGAGAMHSTMTNLKMAWNYKTNIQETYRAEGAANAVASSLWQNLDMNNDSLPDGQQVHGNTTITYTYDGYPVTIYRYSGNPHLAVVQVGNIELVVNNWPGGGVSCGANSKCEPRIYAWREL